VSEISSDTPTETDEAVQPKPPEESGAEPAGEEEHAAAGEPRTYSRGAFRAAVALAIVFFIGTVVAVVFAAQQHRQLQDSKDARAGVEQVASRMTSALLTYDYRDLDKTKQAVLGLATGKFRTDYDQQFSGLSALFTSTKGQSTATVKDVFVSSIQDNTATAIVVYDERAQGTSGARLNVDLYLRLSLVKVNGQWRVDDVSPLSVAPQGPNAATPAPPTTVPAK
jgi:Mce-associated membrane protein